MKVGMDASFLHLAITQSATTLNFENFDTYNTVLKIIDPVLALFNRPKLWLNCTTLKEACDSTVLVLYMIG